MTQIERIIADWQVRNPRQSASSASHCFSSRATQRLAIDCEDDIGADDGANAAARAEMLTLVKLHRTVAARVEFLAKSKDMLRTRLDTQAASLAAVGLNGDSASGHERSPLSDSSAIVRQGGEGAPIALSPRRTSPLMRRHFPKLIV